MCSEQLSRKALENLKRNETFRSKESKWVKLADGEEEVFEFDPEDIELVPVEYDGIRKKRLQYGVVNSIGNPQLLIACKKTSRDIDGYLWQGYTRLKIRRIGLGKETEYQVSPA